jgi:hypothetical protein
MEYDWKDIQITIDNGSAFQRDPIHQEEYKSKKKYISELYETYEDYVKIAFLKWSPITSTNCKIIANKSSEMRDFAITPNIFPYNVKDGIYHYLLWSLKELNSNEIEKIISDNNLVDSIWMVNRMENRSVKGVWHAHIFSKTKLYNHIS